MAYAVRVTQRSAEGLPQGRVVALELRNQSLPRGSIAGSGDGRARLREELLLLELHSLPWGVAQDDIEAPAVEYLRELDGPVEEAVFGRQSLDKCPNTRRGAVRVNPKPANRRGCDPGPIGRLRTNEGS